MKGRPSGTLASAGAGLAEPAKKGLDQLAECLPKVVLETGTTDLLLGITKVTKICSPGPK